jgi:integrase
MGTTRFILRADKPDKEGRYPVDLLYQLSGQRKYFRTKEKLLYLFCDLAAEIAANQAAFDQGATTKSQYLEKKKKLAAAEKAGNSKVENWNDRNQKVIYLDSKIVKNLFPTIDYSLLPSTKEADGINNRLSAFKDEIENIERRFELNREVYSAEMVIKALKGNRSPITKKEAPNVFDCIEKYIEDNKTLKEHGSLYVYKALKGHLHDFKIKKKKKITFDNIDYSFFLEFQNFLINTKNKKAPNGLGNIHIAKLLSTLKTFLSHAKKTQKIQVSDEYKEFKLKSHELEVIALTEKEFQTLYNFDLSNNKRLDQVRDAFCFSCTTALRYSDIKQLKRENIGNGAIRVTITKTKQPLVIALNPYSQSILDKYSDRAKPIPVISNPKINEYLRELCKLAEINDPVQIVRFRGTKREEITYPKHEIITFHCGRKTMATLSLERGMSAEEVMKIGGWRTYSSFKRYVNITEQRAQVVMRNAWGEIRKPIMKAV